MSEQLFRCYLTRQELSLIQRHLLAGTCIADEERSVVDSLEYSLAHALIGDEDNTKIEKVIGNYNG